ncbi:Glucan endo-1,3-beta-D-glucosidase [Handroanthus impetiginosus]|uniref:Glucan endo-1,3-beta-D-glucosidase n=1 Tax=Handroanthus impetiginosus TaxID=429701 RepID=A0A2G9G0Z8_9LAMI|nr:Glucan endo-1,3-beta-D-glucosidase [Handroanthus impetiginosus]
MNMIWLLSFFYLLMFFTAKGQEYMDFLALHDPDENGLTMAVQVETEHLKNVSNSVLMAETWVRNHVLAHYPATNVSKIIVGHNVLCNKNQEHNLGLLLPSIKNIHYSLTRWGLQNDIKVAASFSSNCLVSDSEAYRADIAETYIKPLLNILHEMGSSYVVNPPPHLHTLSEETSNLLNSHSKSMKNLGDFHLETINVIITTPRKERPSSRKLAFIDIRKIIDPFPPRPTPRAPFHSPSGSLPNPAYAASSPLPPLVGTISPQPNSLPTPIAPFHSPSGSVPKPPYAARSPLPPLVGTVSPSLPPAVNSPSPPFLPHLAPMANPASPPFGPHLPPCSPSDGGRSVGAPVGGVLNGLWCVAKPNVPPETLQVALDYACGEGGADCDAIRTDGSCYYPDTLVAHASYAFNSYWQNNKKNGGTCGFGGTAMLINSDPSYRHCRFVLT